MRSKKSSMKTYVSDAEESSDEEVGDSDDGSCVDEIVDSGCSLKSKDVISARMYHRMPQGTLFLGLFQGAIPSQLDGLTMVEHSMISLYSNLTRITIQAGLHYHAKPTVYTVVNDLTSVVKRLPNFADVNAFAILRHRTSQKVK